MRIHHLNCGTSCPWGGRLFDGDSASLLHGHIVCHCLLIESDAGLILVDTGFGRQEMADHRRIAALFRGLNRPQLRAEETAWAQVRALGFDPLDVRHILITHLDFDHAGGIEDFPNATVHLLAREKEVAERGAGGVLVGKLRYRRRQWDDVTAWQLYPSGAGERWFGFDAVRELTGLPPEILLVPLSGHTWGHCGVAIDTGAGWLLHAGDAYFHRDEMRGDQRRCPPGMRAYQTLMEVDRSARLGNQARLRALSRAEGSAVRLFCAHDRVELAELQRQPATMA